MQQTIKPYEELLKQYAHEIHLDQYRQKHFQEWCSDVDGCSYCVSQGTWPFFGFIPRPNQDTLCIAVNHKKNFLYLRKPTSELQRKVEGQNKIWKLPRPQSWQDSFLDMTVAHPLFLQQLPWKLVPGSLELWDDDQLTILVAQLVRPLGRFGTDPERDLSHVLFKFMDQEILRFLIEEFPVVTLGQYQFLWESSDAEERQMRMHSLLQQQGIVPRFPVDAL